jgi:hypothetical protein
MSLTLHKCIGIEPNKYIIRNFTKHVSMYNTERVEKNVYTSLQTQWGSLQVSDFGAPSTTHHKQQPKMSSAATDAL